MDTKKKTFDERETEKSAQENIDLKINPFGNHQAVEKDVAPLKEVVQNEQQFKQAQTERD